MFSRHSDGATQSWPEAYELVSEESNDGHDTRAAAAAAVDTSTEAALAPTAKQGLEEGNATTKDTAATPKRIRSVLRVWWPEMALCALVFLTLGAIIALRASDGEPFPKLPYKLSINTLVAAYILVMKASILVIISNGLGQLKWAWFSSDKPRSLDQLGMLDDASHDFQGAFVWLWRMRVGLSIPSAGAILLLLTTILDPFG